METKEVIKYLLELRDELYLNEQITMNGVWKLNGAISKIQEETGIDEEEIGYTAPDLSTYLDENICKNEKRWVNVKHIEKDYDSCDRRGESD